MSVPPAASSGGAVVTVEMALRLPSLRRGGPHVVAGRCNLHRRIRWVHSCEVPNIATLLKGDELLLMTGMGIGRRPVEQRRFIRALADRGVAGAVIELGQVYARLPEPLLDEARARDLPLVELRREVPFVEVTEEIHSAIVSRQLAVLRRGDELHRRFTDLMLEGAGIPDILSALASAIANPVLLEKAAEGVLYHATHRAPAADVLAAWELADEETRWGPASGSRSATASPSAAASGTPPDGAVVCPVPAAGHRTWGRLVALPLDSPLDDFDRAAVEGAVALVSLALLRREQETLLATRERGNFLADVAAGRLDPADAAARAGALGFPARPARLLALAIAARERDEAAAWTPVWRAVVEHLDAHGVAALLGARREGEALMVVHLARSREEVAALAAEALRMHLGRPDLAALAVGPSVPGWAELGPALELAARTADHVRAAPPRPWHDATVPDVDRLLWGMRQDPELRRFVESRLGPVLDHDRRRAAKLMPTLEALCDTAWRKAQTARALHMNRQSLYPHLERLERLLGVDLDDARTRLGLEIAVHAWRQSRV